MTVGTQVEELVEIVERSIAGVGLDAPLKVDLGDAGVIFIDGCDVSREDVPRKERVDHQPRGLCRHLQRAHGPGAGLLSRAPGSRGQSADRDAVEHADRFRRRRDQAHSPVYARRCGGRHRKRAERNRVGHRRELRFGSACGQRGGGTAAALRRARARVLRGFRRLQDLAAERDTGPIPGLGRTDRRTVHPLGRR